MVEVPADKPLTTPAVSTDATNGALLFQTPPDAVLLRLTVSPAHTEPAPVIAPADSITLTVTTRVAISVPHTFTTVYDMTTVPALVPVTTPVLPTLAIAVLLLVHVPPAEVLFSVIVEPAHTVVSPEIIPANGSGLTVTTCKAVAEAQLLVTVYEIVDVPAATPLTIPDVPTVAIPSLALAHEPPGIVLLNDVTLSSQTAAVPVIKPATGN
jgi:hypothetical protein